MKGVQYVVDDKGKAQAVIIDLKQNRKLWEDFWDLLVSQSRKNEPRVSWDEVKAQLRKRGIIR